MKLLLTSTGLSHLDILKAFKGLLDKDISEVTVAFVPTASRSSEELEYVQKSRNELLVAGVQNISVVDFAIQTSLENFDVLYVCGGNTFHLLNEINKNNYRTQIEKFVKSNKVYVGVSAGSIILSPTIAIAGVEPGDTNDVELKDLRGLGLMDFEVSPHSPEIVIFDAVERYAKEHKRKIWAISDRSALVVKDNKVEVVGEKVDRFFNLI